MARSDQRGRKNNNPEGHNQYSKGWKDTFRKNPVASAAAAGAAAAAGLFLWSKRDKIGEQMSNMSDRAGEWTDKMRSGRKSGEFPAAGKRSAETGSETVGQSSMASASTGSMGASRATGGRSGKAQSGQNLNPSRSATETVG